MRLSMVSPPVHARHCLLQMHLENLTTGLGHIRPVVLQFQFPLEVGNGNLARILMVPVDPLQRFQQNAIGVGEARFFLLYGRGRLEFEGLGGRGR